MITCLLLGHDFVNEVQTITQLFCPGERFSFIHAMPEVYPKGYLVATQMAGDTAVATVYRDGCKLATHALGTGSLPLHLNPRRVLMLAAYHALQSAIGAYTPWGALTGIRPSKMVREWLLAGWAPDKIRHTLETTFCCHCEKAALALTVAQEEMAQTQQIYTMGSNPVGIYVSVPFCPSRCLYCSFNVQHNYGGADIFTQYVAAVAVEIAEKANMLKDMGGTLSSIYIGGGTPTVLPEHLLAQLLQAVDNAFHTTSQAIEYTVEAGRPDTLTKGKLDILRQYGANRIAVNPQTLNDHTLEVIGRHHKGEDFVRGVALARDAGFTSVNADVIVGLPGENIEDVRRTMEGIHALGLENVTVHTLAIKRASRLNEMLANYQLPTAKATEDMLNLANACCAEAGLSPYYMYRQKNMVGMFENVGYSKAGHQCLYNVGMMAETQTVLGVGAGAVSKFVAGDTIRREFNVKNPQIYVERMTCTERNGIEK